MFEWKSMLEQYRRGNFGIKESRSENCMRMATIRAVYDS
jgi:hypothetical protein